MQDLAENSGTRDSEARVYKMKDILLTYLLTYSLTHSLTPWCRIFES